MSEYTAKDAVEMAFNSNVSGFRNVVNDLLLDKVYDAVEMHKVQVSANFLAPEPEEVTQDDN